MKTKKINGREIAESGFTRHLEKVFPSKPTQKECPECRTVSLGGTYHGIDCSFFKKEPNHTAKQSSDVMRPPTPLMILKSMTPDGNVGPRTIEAMLKSNDVEGKAFIVRAVNAHEEMLTALRDIARHLPGHLFDKDGDCTKDSHPYCVLCYVHRTIAKAEGRL